MGEHKVYFLMHNNEPVYIGYSSSIEDRIKSHISSGLEFDSYCYESFDSKEEALQCEADLILDFKPKYNSPSIKGTHIVSRVASDLNSRYVKVTEADVIQCAHEIGQEVVDFNGTMLLVGSTVKLRRYMRTVKDGEKKTILSKVKKIEFDEININKIAD